MYWMSVTPGITRYKGDARLAKFVTLKFFSNESLCTR